MTEPMKTPSTEEIAKQLCSRGLSDYLPSKEIMIIRIKQALDLERQQAEETKLNYAKACLEILDYRREAEEARKEVDKLAGFLKDSWHERCLELEKEVDSLKAEIERLRTALKWAGGYLCTLVKKMPDGGIDGEDCFQRKLLTKCPSCTCKEALKSTEAEGFYGGAVEI